jgi:hypothetical protein
MKKFKDILKKNPEPARGSNSDPGQLGQYSATNQVKESASLNSYLQSRGINPSTVSKETKISHSKSNEFLSWQKNRQFEEVTLDEGASLNAYLKTRGLNPDILTMAQKVAYAKSNAFISWQRIHNNMNEDTTTSKSDGDNRSKNVDSPTTRRANELKASAQHYAVKPVKTKADISVKKEGSQMTQLTPEHVVNSGSGYKLLSKKTGKSLGTAKTKSAIEKRERQVQFFKHQHEEVEQVVESPKEGGKKKFSGMFNPAPKGTFAYDQAMRKKKHDDIEKNQSKDGSGMSSAIDRLQKHMNKEETELDEMDQKFVDSLNKLASKYDFTKTKSGKEVPKQKKPFRMGNEPIGKVKEDVYSDAKSATQVVLSPGEATMSEKKSKVQKIREIFQRMRMSEDTYDWEKADKSVQTYGKKPKFEKADKDDSKGEKQPAAAAVMSGGTTLTGEKRDDVEIDPMMRSRPGQPDPTKTKDKDKK